MTTTLTRCLAVLGTIAVAVAVSLADEAPNECRPSEWSLTNTFLLEYGVPVSDTELLIHAWELGGSRLDHRQVSSDD